MLENKAQKLKRLSLEALSGIVTGTRSEVGYAFCDQDKAAWLEKNEYVEVNASIVNGAEQIACRAIQKGFDYIDNQTSQTKGESKMSFEIETGIEVPKSKRTGKQSVYPFDALEVGQSFFVPATEKQPEPSKSLASTVAAAMKKYDVADCDENGVQKTKDVRNPKTGEIKTGVPAMKHTRIFKLSYAEKDGVAGARIFRTA